MISQKSTPTENIETEQCEVKKAIGNAHFCDKWDSIRRCILEYENEVQDKYSVLKGEMLGVEERELVITDMNAFLFGIIADQSVKAEVAWSLPYHLKQRLGSLDMGTIACMSECSLAEIMRRKPALHRYPSNIAKYIRAASVQILECYAGNAANIWANASATDVIRKLEKFKGVSHKKAALCCLLLVRDLGIKLDNMNSIELVYDLHSRRVCMRTGLSTNDTYECVTEVGRIVFPEFPGRLTNSLWAIGRDFCRPLDPLCDKCPLKQFCEYRQSVDMKI